MAGDSSDNLRIFESAIPLTPQDTIASQLKAIDWKSVVTTGWGTVEILIRAGEPALMKWGNSIRLTRVEQP